MQSAISKLKSAFSLLTSDFSMFPITESADGVTFAVKVQPRAKKNGITGIVGDALKLSLTAPPVDGRANEACIEFFADLFHRPQSAVTIVSGQSSRRKIVRIAGIQAEQLIKALRESPIDASLPRLPESK